MARQTGNPVGCLVSILVVLTFLAAFGIVSWETVGQFTRFIVLLFVSLVLAIGGWMAFVYVSSRGT